MSKADKVLAEPVKLWICDPCKRGRHDMCLNVQKGITCICKLTGHGR